MSILAANRAISRVPGYATEWGAEPSGIKRAVQLFLLIGFPMLACEQLFLIGPRLYLAQFGKAIEHGFVFAGLAALPIGGYLAMRFKRASQSSCLALELGALLLVLSAYARFFTFDAPRWLSLLANVPGLACAAALGYATGGARSTAVRWLRSKDGSWLWLEPFFLISIVTVLTAAALVGTLVGPLRASLAIAGGLLLAAGALHGEAIHRSRPRLHLGFAGTVYLLLCLTALYTEWMCPFARVVANVQPLVYLTETEKSRVEVTVGQGGLHYFVDGELRFSTIDEKRWAQSLALPALARIAHPNRALVLSLGEGLIERELLAFAPKLAVTSVIRDRRLADLAQHQWFLRQLTADSLNSPRVTLIEQDPAVYARDLSAQTFDVIIVDLPDPSGPREHKYYTHRFYAELGAHLSPKGILAVQATSARRSPRSFRIIGATLESAGLITTPLMVPLTTRGEWSLYLATKGPLPAVTCPDRYRNTFPGSIEPQLMTPWPDTLPPKDFEAKPNTQHEAQLMEWFDYETGHPNRD